MLYLGKKNNKISSANRQLEPLALMAWLLQSLLAPSTLKMVVSNYLIAGQLLNNVCDPLSSNSVSAARAQWLGQYSLSFRMNNSRGSKNPPSRLRCNAGSWCSNTVSHLSCTLSQMTNSLSLPASISFSRLFSRQMRSTRKVSVWPVAFVGGLRYESPKVNAAGKVYGWKTVFDPHRPFAIDMAGFAINLRLILFKPQAYFKLRGVKGGYQESSLLRELVTLNDLEPKAANCTKVISSAKNVYRC